MIKKVKFSKIAIVIFLTALIWVWVDLRLDERLSIADVTINITKSTDPSVWFSFNEDGGSSVLIDSVELKGPASRVAEAKRMLDKGTLERAYFLDPKRQGMTDPGTYSLNVSDFVKHSEQMQDLGLTVESCDPESISVKVVKLVKKSLIVRCFDENNAAIQVESTEPARVEAFVLDDWEGEKLSAKVQMTQREISQARSTAIEKRPYIELPGGQTRDIPTIVKIKMPPAEDLRQYSITTATLGFCLSDNLQGKYEVELLNPTDMSTVLIKATPAAKQAYELQQPFQIMLYILDDDKNVATEQRRTVSYNFPEEFVRRDEIVLNQSPVQARFRLVPLSSESAEKTTE